MDDKAFLLPLNHIIFQRLYLYINLYGILKTFLLSHKPIKHTVYILKYTLPETNSSHLKIGHPKRKLIFQPSIFGCELLVSGRVMYEHMFFFQGRRYMNGNLIPILRSRRMPCIATRINRRQIQGMNLWGATWSYRFWYHTFRRSLR